MQATAFASNTGIKFANGGKQFAQTFTLPGEAEKAAKILQSFLGMYLKLVLRSRLLNIS